MKKELSKEYLHELFEYRDGNLYWKVKKAHRVKIGDKFGCHKEKGYSHGGIDGTNYLLHRLIYAWHHGEFPKYIDHIDNNPSNNNIENLRKANWSQNQCNKKLLKSNTSGYKGVTWVENRNKWVVRVQANNKQHQIGYFDDLELAELVAIEARAKHHGQYARSF